MNKAPIGIPVDHPFSSVFDAICHRSDVGILVYTERRESWLNIYPVPENGSETRWNYMKGAVVRKD